MKDPAFLFYPNDYLGGTMGMSFEEKGAYMELLMLQFNRGHMTSHMIGQTVGQLWDKIQDKFIQDEKGLYYNVRLEQEQNRRKTFTDSRKNNLKGVNQYSNNTNNKGHINGHTTSRMENENRNENINTLILEKESVREKIKFADLENESWFMGVLSFLGMKIGMDELRTYWAKYQQAMIADDDLYRDKLSYRSHFRNWVKIQVEKNGKDSGIMKADYSLINQF